MHSLLVRNCFHSQLFSWIWCLSFLCSYSCIYHVRVDLWTMYRISLHVIISQINNITLMYSSGVCFFFFYSILCFWALSILMCMLNLVHSFSLLYSSPVTEYMMAYYPFSLTLIPSNFFYYYTMLFLLRFLKIINFTEVYFTNNRIHTFQVCILVSLYSRSHHRSQDTEHFCHLSPFLGVQSTLLPTPSLAWDKTCLPSL